MLIHQKTKNDINRILDQVPHAILLVGQEGIGKEYIAKHIILRLLKIESLENYAYFHKIDANLKGIDAVRDLRSFLGKKTTGKQSIRRAVLLINADSLGSSAQNALLKTIEEPPEDTVIVLTATDSTQLLATIHSRVQRTHIIPLELEQVLQIPKLNMHDRPKLTKAFYMSGGLPGLMMAILQNAEHPLIEGLEKAKYIVKASIHDRLCLVESIIKSETGSLVLLDSLQRVLSSGFYIAVKTSNIATTKKLHKARLATSIAKLQLDQNANQKLVLTNLFINL